MDRINLSLTLAQVNQILEALGQQPYADVYELIEQIQQQAQAQLQDPAASPPQSAATTEESQS